LHTAFTLLVLFRLQGGLSGGTYGTVPLPTILPTNDTTRELKERASPHVTSVEVYDREYRWLCLPSGPLLLDVPINTVISVACSRLPFGHSSRDPSPERATDSSSMDQRPLMVPRWKLPPPPQPWTEDAHGLPPPSPAPFAGEAEHATPSTRQGRKRPRDAKDTQNHCRWFDFGQGLCKYSPCRMWHVDERCYDHHERVTVPEGDARFVTAAVLTKLRECHRDGRTPRCGGVTKEESSPPDNSRDVSAADAPAPMTDTQLQQWLNAARTEEMDASSPFLRDIISLRLDGGTTCKRFPFETAALPTAAEGTSARLEVHQVTDVTWCAMLYGSGKTVMKHLESCLLLGWQLRYALKPLLAQRGVRMENVLFVTETALEEAAFRACSFVWSMQFKSLPVVHASRLEQTSGHLIGENCDPAHVFLKIEAFKMDSTIAIISDLDIVVTNVEILADKIESFLPCGKYGRLFEPGTVAVMQRSRSKVRLGSSPVWVNEHRDSQNNYMPVSYCFAVLQPSQELADRYETKMRESGCVGRGRLSDQVLLAEVLDRRFLLLDHDFIAFPSWWVHSDLYESRAQDLWRLKQEHEHTRELSWHAFGKGFLSQLGAVHLSKTFSLTETTGATDTRHDVFLGAMAHGNSRPARRGMISVSGGRKVQLQQYLEFLHGFWNALVMEHRRQKREFANIVRSSVGHKTPGLGLSKALFAIGEVEV
jgi:hypothetical protein